MRMFVDHRRVVDRAYEQVLPAFVGRPGLWLPDLVKDSMEQGYGATTRLVVGPLSKRVAVRVGEPLVGKTRLVAPIRVMATGPEGLFPHLDANLEINTRDPESIEVRLVGTYRPPLGRAGEMLDRAGLHKIAESTLETFIDEMASRFEHPTFLASMAQ